jgi:hypothetical protein
MKRMSTPPAADSRPMHAYMQDILGATGLMSEHSSPINRFMGNYQTHLENGRFDVEGDICSLTEARHQNFLSRLSNTFH